MNAEILMSWEVSQSIIFSCISVAYSYLLVVCRFCNHSFCALWKCCISCQNREDHRSPDSHLWYDLLLGSFTATKTQPNTLYNADTSGLNLSPEEYNIIKGWFPNRTFKRIYSSRDDHRSGHVEDFKRQVGGFATTLVIITATNGLKFGGYLHPAWGFTGNYIYDTSNPIQSFIFSLKPFTGQAQRYYVHSTGHVAAFGQSSYGVDFGPDDLYVNNALVVTHSNTGHIATRGNEFIGGGSSIQASLIEAYHVSY